MIFVIKTVMKAGRVVHLQGMEGNFNNQNGIPIKKKRPRVGDTRTSLNRVGTSNVSRDNNRNDRRSSNGYSTQRRDNRGGGYNQGGGYNKKVGSKNTRDKNNK
ncbi:MAG: hypothetical protein ACLVKO_07600 [Dysgonomonas sp.]